MKIPRLLNIVENALTLAGQGPRGWRDVVPLSQAAEQDSVLGRVQSPLGALPQMQDRWQCGPLTGVNSGRLASMTWRRKLVFHLQLAGGR